MISLFSELISMVSNHGSFNQAFVILLSTPTFNGSGVRWLFQPVGFGLSVLSSLSLFL
jgi:hypothetical protein